MQGTGPDGKPDGLPWTVKHGAAGVNGLGMNMIVDGVNEQGLSGGLFYFPSYAGFQDVPAADAGRSLAPWDLLTWALTSFATVAEVTAALPGVHPPPSSLLTAPIEVGFDPLRAWLRIAHCTIQSVFTVPEVVTLATKCISALAW